MQDIYLSNGEKYVAPAKPLGYAERLRRRWKQVFGLVLMAATYPIAKPFVEAGGSWVIEQVAAWRKGVPQGTWKMTDSELAPYRDALSGPRGKDVVQIAEPFYDNNAKSVVMRLVNVTDQDQPVDAIVLDLHYQNIFGAKMLPEDTIDLGNLGREASKAKSIGKPFEFLGGVHTSYKIPPKTAERYDVAMNLAASDLFIPPGGTEGSFYQLNIKLKVNGVVTNNVYELVPEKGLLHIRKAP